MIFKVLERKTLEKTKEKSFLQMRSRNRLPKSRWWCSFPYKGMPRCHITKRSIWYLNFSTKVFMAFIHVEEWLQWCNKTLVTKSKYFSKIISGQLSLTYYKSSENAMILFCILHASIYLVNLSFLGSTGIALKSSSTDSQKPYTKGRFGWNILIFPIKYLKH